MPFEDFVNAVLQNMSFENTSLNGSKNFKIIALGCYFFFILLLPIVISIFNWILGVLVFLGYVTIISLENI